MVSIQSGQDSYPETTHSLSSTTREDSKQQRPQILKRSKGSSNTVRECQIWKGNSTASGNVGTLVKCCQLLIRSRYCIDCSDSRFLSEAEKKFLAFFQNRAVPIVFVLTKFDLVIAQCLSYRLINSGSAMVDWVPMRTLAIGDASERVKKDIHRPLEKILGGGVKTEMVSKESKYPLSPVAVGDLTSPADPELVEQLVIETTKVVKPNLKQLWIGAQQVIADNKRQGMSDVPSINHWPGHANFQTGAIACSIKAISSTYIRAGILIPVPLVKPVFHQDIFHRIYTMIRLQWNICDHGYLERDAVVTQFQDLCQGSLFSFGRAVDPTGPLTGPHYMREYLRWAADLNIAFEILFWKLKERGNRRLMSPTVSQSNQRVLKKAEVEDVLAQFQNSRLRTLAHTQINGSVNNFDLSLPFKRKDLSAILESAVDTATAEGEKEGFWSHRSSRSVSSDHVAELE